MTPFDPCGSTHDANELEKVRRETNERQATASDPAVSVWVAANAGTGKTHVLTMRVLRLLLADTKPERILSLTYTKAAAAEMANRVFGKLSQWVTAAPQALEAELVSVLSRAPSEAETARARQLFARAIETPGGLKVQTIHAFCERLLQRFPLEAGVPPGFEILDDVTGDALRRHAVDEVLREATSGRTPVLRHALEVAIAYAVDDRFDDRLAEVLRERDLLDGIVRLNADGEGGAEGVAKWAANLRRALGVHDEASTEILDRQMAQVLGDDDLDRSVAVLLMGTANDLKSAERFAAARGASSHAARASALATALLTQKGEPRARLLTKSLVADHPDVDRMLQDAQSRLLDLLHQRRALEAIDATTALVRLADAVMQRYTVAKARRAALDFDDLIETTANLLVQRQAAQWVLFKLDGGLDHILIDESQDTSQLQWQVIEALAQEFFAGDGSREEVRTVFAVGDEKQSIYSFQGAAPEMFARSGAGFEARARRAGRMFERVSLILSFRTVTPLLAAVDRVFADRARTPGLTAGEDMPRHVAARAGHAGLVEIWPTETPEVADPSDAWSPLAERAPSSPVSRVAERIAQTIREWLDSGERLESENRPVQPGDVLILVARRQPFAQPMITALKQREIPVAGADRIHVIDQIAVQDLMALADFLTLPEDDLALASVLKSPLIGLDDDDLMAIGLGRRGPLWQALLASAEGRDTYAAAVETLKRWRHRADLAPPYEFFASLLERDGGRRRLLDRLGPEAADPIDEFLALALTYDEAAAPSLTGFIGWLRASDHEIKRDMEHGRNAVRVMTVHGAKGLEAPIVFLPDTCSAPAGQASRDGLVALEGIAQQAGLPDALIWPVKGSTRVPGIAEARERQRARETEERNRLLYVALTRARDRLYVTGFEGVRPRSKGCWYDLISEQLSGLVERVTLPDGREVLRSQSQQKAQPAQPRRHAGVELEVEPLPEWAQADRPAPREPQIAVPLAPSRFAPYEIDEEGEPAEPGRPAGGGAATGQRAPAAPSGRQEPQAGAAGRGGVPAEPSNPSPRVLVGDRRLLRGTLTHALLEHLPELPREVWPEASRAFLELRGTALSARVRESIAAETLAVLNAPEFAHLFAPEARAEVAIATELENPRPGGAPLRINGQIDRLARTGDEVWIVDYKTNRPGPDKVEGVAAAYLYQLAAYRLAIRAIYPAANVRAAILWTEAPRILEIPGKVLDDHEQRLWEIDPASLDAGEAAS